MHASLARGQIGAPFRNTLKRLVDKGTGIAALVVEKDRMEAGAARIPGPDPHGEPGDVTLGLSRPPKRIRGELPVRPDELPESAPLHSRSDVCLGQPTLDHLQVHAGETTGAKTCRSILPAKGYGVLHARASNSCDAGRRSAWTGRAEPGAVGSASLRPAIRICRR